MGTGVNKALNGVDDEVLLAEEKGAVRIATLNRPSVLNCINLPMVAALSERYEKWENDDSVQLIILKGAGRVFSAGGDLKNFYAFGKSSPGCTEIVYRKYWLDYHIGTFKKPIVSLMHGVSVGGGATMAILGSFQVATEKTIFVMPEAAIGHHTDCGASYILSHLPGRLGEYLALTGERLDGAELVACGLASNFVPLESLSDLESELVTLENPSKEAVKVVLDKYSVSPKLGERSVLHRQADIGRWFSKDTVEEIVATLEEVLKESEDEWVKKTVTLLKRASPTGLKMTFRSIREGRNEPLETCLKREFRLTINNLRALISDDLYEGIRATVLDKDKNPKWNPASLVDVEDKALDLAFHAFPEGQELRLPSDPEKLRWEGKYDGFIVTFKPPTLPALEDEVQQEVEINSPNHG